MNPLLEKAIGQYKHENYEEALVLLKKVRQDEPQSTIAAYYEGLTYKKMQDYKAAIPALRDAVTYSPKIKGALVELIDCLGQTGDLDEAAKWIDEAEREDIRPAQVAFLKGLILMKQDRAAEAIESFKKAERLDPSMSQVCEYQVGMANLKLKKYGEARNVFRQVIVSDPRSTVANYANEYIDALERGAAPAKPWRLEVGEYWQYDDNVVLMPDEESLVSGISNQSDSREVTTALGEYVWKPNEWFDLRSTYTFYWGKQNDLGFYDTVNNAFYLQPEMFFGNSMAAFTGGYSHYLVNDKAYLSMPTVGGYYSLMVDDNNMFQASIRYNKKDYLWKQTDYNENRCSDDFGGATSWFYFFTERKGFINARYAFNKEETKGNNWDYLGNRITAVLLFPGATVEPLVKNVIPEKLNIISNANLTVSGDMYMQQFTNTHTVYNVRRKDEVYTVSALFAYKFYKDSEIQLQYTFTKDDSNISVYKYTRNVYSVGVNLKF